MDKKTALELYTLFRQENSLWLGKHREHSQQYFTLVIAILAASIAAVPSFMTLHRWLLSLIIIGPLINLIFCRIGFFLCDRSYQAYLESISVQAKLEQIIGLTKSRQRARGNLTPVFAEDEHFLPERWLDKSRDFATAGMFVEDKLNKGANKLIKQTFVFLAWLNLAAATIIGLVAFGFIS
jgi:hypothetical protein